MLVVVVGLAAGVSGSRSGAYGATCSGPWQPVSPTLATGELTDVVYAPGVGYVAVGRGGAVVTSPDGLSWTPRWTGFPGDFLAVTWGNGLFVAVGNLVSAGDPKATPLIATSPDGVTWTRRDCPEHRQLFARLSAVAWTGSAFVALSDNTKAWVSADGLSWPPAGTTMEGAHYFGADDLTWDGSRLLAVGTGTRGRLSPARGTVMASPDGVHWTWDFSLGEDEHRGLRVAAHDGVAVMISERRILTSGAPGQWFAAGLDAQSSFGDVVWTGSAFLTTRTFPDGGTGSRVLTSPDGVAWIPLDGTTSIPIGSERLAAGPGLLVGVGSRSLVSSPDARLWTQHATTTLPPSLSDVVWTGRDFVAAAGEVLLTSLDGLTWETQPDVTGTWMLDVVSGQDTVLALGATGDVWRRVAGGPWEQRTSGTTLVLSEGIWAGTRFLVLGSTDPYGQDATILSSPDGMHWEQMAGEIPSGLSKLAWSGREVLGLAGSQLYRSAYGAAWELVASQAGSASFFDLAASPETVVLVGHGRPFDDVIGCGYNLGSVEFSHDLSTWQGIDFPGRLESVTWDGERFLAVGQCGLVVSSRDGEHWLTEVAMPWSGDLETVASSGRAAVAAGPGSIVGQPQCTHVGTVRRRLAGPASGPVPACPSDSSGRVPERPDPLASGM